MFIGANPSPAGLLQKPKNLAAIFLAVIFCLPASRAQGPEGEPEEFLRRQIRLSEEQLANLQRGQAVAKVLDTAHPVEIPLFGAIRVRVPGSFLIEKYRDIAGFKKSKEVLQIGKFSSPPQLQDLDALILEPGDVEALGKCRTGDCALKLPSGAIERFRADLNRSSPTYSKDAVSSYRRFLFELVCSYLANGNAALPVYHDKKAPVSLAAEFLSILDASPYIRRYAAALDPYLRNYPRSRPEDTEEFLYWSREKFGYKAVVSLTHATIFHSFRPEADWTLIASKQLYANHYIQGSLGLAMFVEKKGQGPSAGGYLVYLNRSRADLPQGLFSGLVRYFVKRRVLDGMEKYLRLIKERLESEYREESSAKK